MRTYREQLANGLLGFSFGWGIPLSIANPSCGIPTTIICFLTGKYLIEEGWRQDRLAETRNSVSTLTAYSMASPPAYVEKKDAPTQASDTDLEDDGFVIVRSRAPSLSSKKDN